MQVAVGVAHFACHLAMDRGDSLQLEETAVQHGDKVLHPLYVPANDALVRRVHDEEVDAGGLLERAAHLALRCVDDADAPIDLLPLGLAPRHACGAAFSGEVADEEGGCLHAGEHEVALGPGPGAEETGRFA